MHQAKLDEAVQQAKSLKKAIMVTGPADMVRTRLLVLFFVKSTRQKYPVIRTVIPYTTLSFFKIILHA